VRGVERDGGAGARPGAGAVAAREDEGRSSDREPPRDGPCRALPGAGEAVHPGHRGTHQVVARLRRRADALISVGGSGAAPPTPPTPVTRGGLAVGPIAPARPAVDPR